MTREEAIAIAQRDPQIPDLRNILSLPTIYTWFQRTVRGLGEYIYVERHVGAQSGDRVLDLGCGTGDILRYMPPVQYLGIDSDEKAIESARKNYSNRGAFYCMDLSQEKIPYNGSFDLVIATGVLHHLTDEQALKLLELACKALVPGKRFVSMDCCYEDGQSFLARWIISKDRGKYVRTAPHYVELASRVFNEVEVTKYDDLLRIPSTMIILECRSSLTSNRS